MVGYYNYTVWLTYISILLATFGIGILIVDVNNSTNYAILCLLVCGALDMFDGKVARTKKDRTEIEKCNGIQIDSLSDLLAFGVLPAAISLRLFLNNNSEVINKWYFIIITLILLLYVLFGLIRLGYFNALENERCKVENEPLKYFTGMPITMASFFLPIVYLLKFTSLTLFTFSWIYIISLAIVGLLFVLKIKVPKASKKMVIAFTIFGVLFLILFIILIK